MVQNTEKYTVITGASSGIGYETAKAFAERGSSLILVARRKNKLETLRQEILDSHPMLDIVVKPMDLSIPQNVFQFYESKNHILYRHGLTMRDLEIMTA